MFIKVIPLTRMPRNTMPISVPQIFPSPPIRLVRPMITTAMTSNSQPLAVVAALAYPRVGSKLSSTNSHTRCQ